MIITICNLIFFYIVIWNKLYIYYKKGMIIDGKKIAAKKYDHIKMSVDTSTFSVTLGVILVWENAASLRYIKQKEKWAEFTGIKFVIKKLPKEISERRLLEEIEKMNKDDSINGFIVQMPLPRHISATKVTLAIAPEKDVDGFHPINVGKILIGDNSGFASCTPAGVMEIFKHENIELTGKNVCIVGASNIVGKPMSALLMNAWATVTVCNSRTMNLKLHTSKSDIVIMAAGVPGLLKVDMIHVGTTVIDVWFTVIDGKIHGDADFGTIEMVGNRITPVPGWVGVMTVAMLMENTFKAAKQQNS